MSSPRRSLAWSAVLFLVAANASPTLAEYELQARVSAGADAGLVAGDHPDDTRTQATPDVGVSTSVSDSLDTICWRDTGLQVHCEEGTAPSGTSIETLSTGNAAADSFAEVTPSIDPKHPQYHIVTLKARAGSSIGGTHTEIAKAGCLAEAQYVTRFHFTRNMDCAKDAISVDVIFRGRSTLGLSGSTHFECNAGNCNADDPKASANIVLGGTWLELFGRTGFIATSGVPIGLNDTRVIGYSAAPGFHEFTAVKNSTLDDIFAAGPDGLRFVAILAAQTRVKGDSTENPTYSLDEEATLVGFVFWATTTRSRLLDLPEGAITITDDAGYRFRVLPVSEFKDLYPNDVAETPCGSVDVPSGNDDQGGGSTDDDGDSDENSCTPGPCGSGCAPMMSAAILGLCALRPRRHRA